MIRTIVHNPALLNVKSAPATEADAQIITDLLDTLQANLRHCVGLAANMIGETKRIIVFCNANALTVMVNPHIVSRSGDYQAQEGCLSLPGVRRAKRYKRITVEYLDRDFQPQVGTFEGFTAQIIQHEVDHCNGVLI